MSKRATLEHVDVDDLLHKRVLPSQPYFGKYHESSQTSTSTPQTRALLWRLELDNNLRCVKPAKRRGESSLLQDGRQRDDMMMMTTNKWPLIKMWSKTAPKGTKRAKVAPTMTTSVSESTGFN